MAAPHGQFPFNHAEKIFLLAEIIKQHAPSPDHLLPIVNNFLGPQQPSWNDIIPPPGRTINQCMHAFGELRRPSYTQPSPMMRPMPSQSTSPMSTGPGGPVGIKRPYHQYSFDSAANYPPGREIRPKVSTGSMTSLSQPSSLEQPPKKKRGRPTKAEVQARAEAQAASADPSPIVARPPSLEMPLARVEAQAASADPSPIMSRPPSLEMPLARPSMTQPLEPPTSEPARIEEGPPPPIARMSVSSMLTPTGQKAASQSSSSSGKRRRGKSTRSEPEDLSRVEESSSRQLQQEYESPYTRMGAETQDSPARAAVLRHRDETETRSPHISDQDQPSTTLPPRTGST